MKRKLRGIILIVVGIIILSAINYGKFNVYRIQQQMKKSVLHNLDDRDKKNKELNISELNLFDIVGESSRYSEQNGDVNIEKLKENTVSSKNGEDFNNGSMGPTEGKKVSKEDNIKNIYENCIGVLSIPKIDLEVAISETVTMENLKYSVSHYASTAGLGENGNCCIAGHRSYAYNEFFNRLNEISKGDYIYVKTADNKFTYKVYDILIVEPTEVWVLDDSEDYEITLITCTPIRVATHRLVIKGKLISVRARPL